LLAPHIQQTVKRIHDSTAPCLLAIQDSCVFNYTSHRAKTEIGRIGHVGNTVQYGLIQHTTLCVTEHNEALGLLDVQHFHYDDFETDRHYAHRTIEEKQNSCWINALSAMREHVGETDKTIITIADREGDFFEFLHALHEAEEAFVIRAHHNRYTGEKHRTRANPLFTLIEQQAALGRMETVMHDVNTHQAQTISLTIKALSQVMLPPPHRTLQGKAYSPIRVNVVMAYNDTHRWLLLTNLAVDTIAACEQVVACYKARWHIEDYHKILKTGYQLDEIYLHASRNAIENLLMMASISACRLYWLIYVGRTDTHRKASDVFEEAEWQSVYVYLGEAIPSHPPTLKEMVISIARLGGYKPQKRAKPPGIKTMWIGFQALMVTTRMYKNFKYYATKT
jgi:hypothetical protein